MFSLDLLHPLPEGVAEHALLPLRIVLGVIMFDSGMGKWRRGIAGTGRWFEGLGLPNPHALACIVASNETVCGVLLVVGLFTPFAAAVIAVNMTVAAWVQKTKVHAPFQGGDVQGYELDVILAAAALTLAIAGAGPLSLDGLLSR
ncbi:MAG: DoxX family protein [Dehalococcoidia bacterium]|nr:MAG: DoxX family protein [Dehalococcoidia bacterium]